MTELAVSPLAPAAFPKLTSVKGVQIATLAAGLRYQKRADLMLCVVPKASTVAGTFTSSLCPSAPVDWCRTHIGSGSSRAVVCNSGNANAFTGKAGETSAELTASVVAEALGIEPSEVLLASTGVIGESLPDVALASSLPLLVEGLTESDDGSFESAAHAIRTTDTFAKAAARTIEIDGVAVNIVGFAKGSGMIAPDMATMLGFVFTDAAVSAPVLNELLVDSVARSYNRITVDSDTSTSDSVFLFATGASGAHEIDSTDTHQAGAFKAALDEINLDLAHQIVRDGEGATKFVEVRVRGADSGSAAKTIGFAIANSPLVKTALAAEDANWGRIVMAVGKAGQRADRDKLNIWIGDEQCAEGGVARSGYSEENATRHLQGQNVTITVDVGVGQSSSTVWTCDLTHGYIDINAGYRS